MMIDFIQVLGLLDMFCLQPYQSLSSLLLILHHPLDTG
jgi:hypothetical protein